MANSKQKSNYIISNAIKAFYDINKLINSLVECSAKDFETLNTNFQNYYKELKQLIEINKKYLASITYFSPEKISCIEQKFNYLNDNIKNLLMDIDNVDAFLSNHLKNNCYGELHINNIKQNISTLKLLTTNVQFEPKYNELYNEIILILEKLSNDSILLENESSKVEKRIKACKNIVTQIKTKRLPTLMEAIINLQNTIDTIKEKLSKTADHNESLENIIFSNTNSSSEIITNLQFQDIIRQKIEHVQKAHENLLKKLENIPEVNNLEDINPETLSQIRDIGTLQAAHLVHANSEYQKAIENITNKFDEIGEIKSESIKLFEKLTKPGRNSNFNKIEFKGNLAVLELEVDQLTRENTNLFHFFDDLFIDSELAFFPTNHIDKIFDSVKHIHEKISFLSKPGISPDQKQQLTPINQLVSSLESLMDSKKEIDHELKNNLKEISNSGLKTGIDYNQTFNNTIEYVFELYEELKSNELDLLNNQYLNKHQLNYYPIMQIEENINQVKYYKIFEKGVEDIIQILNNLIKSINFEGIDLDIDSEELDKLKKLYSMKSERLVHNSVVNGEQDDNNNDEDEVEFF